MCHHPPGTRTGRLRGVAAAVGDVERPPWLPPVRPKVAGPESHRRDLAATGPAGMRRAGPAGGVEPDRGHHWITSSARASTMGGMTRPMALAVFRLTTNSNLLGSWTGR